MRSHPIHAQASLWSSISIVSWYPFWHPDGVPNTVEVLSLRHILPSSGEGEEFRNEVPLRQYIIGGRLSHTLGRMIYKLPRTLSFEGIRCVVRGKVGVNWLLYAPRSGCRDGSLTPSINRLKCPQLLLFARLSRWFLLALRTPTRSSSPFSLPPVR